MQNTSRLGSLVAAVGATAFGSVISGVAWIAAPTSFGAGIIAAIVWFFGKWGAHRFQREWGKSRTKQGDGGTEDNPEEMDKPCAMRRHLAATDGSRSGAMVTAMATRWVR